MCLHIFVPTPIWTQEQCQRDDDEYSWICFKWQKGTKLRCCNQVLFDSVQCKQLQTIANSKLLANLFLDRDWGSTNWKETFDWIEQQYLSLSQVRPATFAVGRTHLYPFMMRFLVSGLLLVGAVFVGALQSNEPHALHRLRQVTLSFTVFQGFGRLPGLSPY